MSGIVNVSVVTEGQKAGESIVVELADDHVEALPAGWVPVSAEDAARLKARKVEGPDAGA